MTSAGGIHHITAITADPQKNLDFYEGFLGQRLVKRTVNFDDPHSYHFYFADATGTPGTLLTFFYFGSIPPRSAGVGEACTISYRISASAKQFWTDRAAQFSVPCSERLNAFGETVLELHDPDGIEMHLVVEESKTILPWWKDGPIPKESSLQGFYGITLRVISVEDIERVLTALGYWHDKHSGLVTRFSSVGLAPFIDVSETPDIPLARQGAGSVHHVALRSGTDAEELVLREYIENLGIFPTPVIDRQYFRSVYFMTPARILFELATDAPGFAIDEDPETLGEKLVLPPQYEPFRQEIEQHLVPIRLPRDHGTH
jgi:catechol 2,3-dioxygenase-like lactoylglutathione lyase family enzyme